MTRMSGKLPEQELNSNLHIWVHFDPLDGATSVDQARGPGRLVERNQRVELLDGDITQTIATCQNKTRRSTEKLTRNPIKKLERKAEARRVKIQEWTAFWSEYCTQNKIRLTSEVRAAITYLHWYCFKKKIDPSTLATSGYPNSNDGSFNVRNGSPLDLAKFARSEDQGYQWVMGGAPEGKDYQNHPSRWPEVKAFDSEHP